MPDELLTLPPAFVRTVENTFGDAGRAWLMRLPTLFAACEKRWKIHVLPAFSNLTYNYVAPVRCKNGTDAVLKAGVPCDERNCEIAALRVYEGRGCARLLASDITQGVMLLERLSPGTPLTRLADATNDSRATHIAANVMRELWRPVPPDYAFPTVADWGRGLERLRARFGGGTGPFPARLVQEAETLWNELTTSAAPPVLLHGDLHHDNILQAGPDTNAWRAIDPKGLVGEPAYETGALLRNLWPAHHAISDPTQLLTRRAHQLADELGFDRARVRGWAVAQAVLSAWWCVEDNGDDWQDTIALAQLLAAIQT